MGQVPVSKKILIVGSGRLAKHWSHYLTLLQIPFINWSRQSQTILQDDGYTHIFLAVSDSAISEIVSLYPWMQSRHTAHFSGANYYDGLYGMHPLMTFADRLYDLSTYTQIPLAIDFDKEKYTSFAFLPNPIWILSPTDKAKYHALCVMGGNFPQILWQLLESHITAMGIPSNAWKTYIQTATQNYLLDSNSLTGPMVRQDTATIQKNLNSLANTNLEPLYESFVRAYNQGRK